MDLKLGNAFAMSVLFVNKTDGFTPVLAVGYGSVTVQYRKEGDASFTSFTLTPSNWIEIGTGVYEIDFDATHADTVGRFEIVVSSTTPINYYGQAQIVETGSVDVQVSGAYDGSTVWITLAMLRDGAAITSPTSATYILYSAVGVQLATGTSTSPDANGVFQFNETLSLTKNTVPYVMATVTDAFATVTSRQFIPVLG